MTGASPRRPRPAITAIRPTTPLELLGSPVRWVGPGQQLHRVHQSGAFRWDINAGSLPSPPTTAFGVPEDPVQEECVVPAHCRPTGWK